MNFKEMKSWLPATGGVAVVLLLIYTAIWLDRVGCGDVATLECLAVAAGGRLADFLWFGWVAKYQTLISGLLALLAAASVVIAAMLQRENDLKDKVEERVQRQIDRISFIEALARRIGHDIWSEDEISEDDPNIVQLEGACFELPAECSKVALHGLYCVSEVRIILRRRDISQYERRRCIGLMWVLICSFEFPERFFVTGRFVRVPNKVPKNERDRLESSTWKDYEHERFAEWLDILSD